jgi:hypothetical protein
MFWKSKPQDTVIREDVFRVTLPGKWLKAPSGENQWTYQTEDQSEQLTVSIMGDNSGLSMQERSTTLERLIEIRRSSELKIPGRTGISVGEATFGESGGVLAACYAGAQAGTQYRFHCLTLASSHTFTFFYYEASGHLESKSEARAKAIFNSIDVPH